MYLVGTQCAARRENALWMVLTCSIMKFMNTRYTSPSITQKELEGRTVVNSNTRQQTATPPLQSATSRASGQWGVSFRSTLDLNVRYCLQATDPQLQVACVNQSNGHTTNAVRFMTDKSHCLYPSYSSTSSARYKEWTCSQPAALTKHVHRKPVNPS